MTSEVLIAHCVDTEGPLNETWQATLECVRKTFAIEVEESIGELERLREGHGLAEPLRSQVVAFLARRDYKRDWSELFEMLNELMSDGWRNSHRDDFGEAYVFSWFILDLVGNVINPRSRSLGFHGVYEKYRNLLASKSAARDRLYWHYHAPSVNGEAHKTSNNFSSSGLHSEVLARRILDYMDFPVAFRPGSHCERPDISSYLELWIPFDFGNQGMEESLSDLSQIDVSQGRFGDWRRAPREWGYYHPDFYDYQIEGGMRRYIFRCLNVDSRIRVLDEHEVRKAFSQAVEIGVSLLAFTSHDEREMRPAIDGTLQLIRKIQGEEFPQTRIRFVNVVEGARLVAGMEPEAPPRLSVGFEGSRMEVSSDKSLWGPQPFFCVRLRNGSYVFENLDFGLQPNSWSFTFDSDTYTLSEIELVGLASHDPIGNTVVVRVDTTQDPFFIESRNLNSTDWLGAT